MVANECASDRSDHLYLRLPPVWYLSGGFHADISPGDRRSVGPRTCNFSAPPAIHRYHSAVGAENGYQRYEACPAASNRLAMPFRTDNIPMSETPAQKDERLYEEWKDAPMGWSKDQAYSVLMKTLEPAVMSAANTYRP